jgi:ADP-L-glycero-D-manno-heptose 6-epimerase
MHIVTGGAGFIGSNVIKGLNAHGVSDILVVDDLAQGEKHRNLDGLDFADYVDLRDFRSRMVAFGRAEAILHLGACSDTMQADGRYMLDNNYEFSKELLNFAQSRRAQFIYASSASVYGDGTAGFREEPACERPLNVYAFSKHLFDRWVRRELPKSASQVVGLRYFNVYGPREGHKGRMASVVHHFHHQALNQGKGGGALKLFAGSEGFRRDFVFVDDAVDVNLHFLERPNVSGIFNCGTGAARSFMELAQIVAANRPGSRIDSIPFPEALKGKYQSFTQAELKRLRDTGFTRPFTTLEDGVGSYLGWLAGTGPA